MELQEEINRAADIVRRGGIILYPTDTVWGIGCDATNSAAVRKVYELKRRADHKAMIVLVDSVAEVEKYVREMPDIACQLIDCAVKPMTIVYDGAAGLAPELTGGEGGVGAFPPDPAAVCAAPWSRPPRISPENLPPPYFPKFPGKSSTEWTTWSITAATT